MKPPSVLWEINAKVSCHTLFDFLIPFFQFPQFPSLYTGTGNSKSPRECSHKLHPEVGGFARKFLQPLSWKSSGQVLAGRSFRARLDLRSPDSILGSRFSRDKSIPAALNTLKFRQIPQGINDSLLSDMKTRAKVLNAKRSGGTL